MKIYAGNLADDVTNEDLLTFFAAHGEVTTANVVRDRSSDRSRGFGFVDMSNDAEGRAAIAALYGKELKGSPVIVNLARSSGEGDAPSGGAYRRRGTPQV